MKIKSYVCLVAGLPGDRAFAERRTKTERQRGSKRWKEASCGQREEACHDITARDLNISKKDFFEFARAQSSQNNGKPKSIQERASVIP